MVVESCSVKRNAKNARGLGRDTAPFPKSCASYFRFARFNTFPLYYPILSESPAQASNDFAFTALVILRLCKILYFLQAFSILSKAKEEDDRKRQALLRFYAKAQDLLSKMDGPMLTLLQRHTKNVKENMKWHEKQLKQTQYFLLVSGK